MNFNLAIYVLLLFGPMWAAASTQSKITLPIEVAGADGTISSTIVSIPAEQRPQVRTLQLQVHGLGYADMISVRVNGCPWIGVNNQSVSVDEPAKSYGGIGGGFSTLTMTIPLPTAAVVGGDNRLDFRFNHADGAVSGFRILAFNFMTGDGRQILPPGTFVREDPNLWQPPLSGQDQISAGRTLWTKGPLKANGLPNATRIRAHCGDCHAEDGQDLKYFNYSNTSIIARSQFHGLSELQGKQIATYIRSLAVANPGRPWNPPFQPGPGIDSQPVEDWAAGAGLAAVLPKDIDTLPFLFSHDIPAPSAFNPDANLNVREIPIALQLPDWNHWLPRVHPLDAWGDRFDRSKFAAAYSNPPHTGFELKTFFEHWLRQRDQFLSHLSPASTGWTPQLSNAVYSTQLWQLVKSWEIMQQFSYHSDSPARLWPNIIPAATAPAHVHIPDGPSGMGGSALTNEYYSNAWYELQMVVSSSNHQHRGRSPVDWVYLAGHFLDLQGESHQAEPGRLLVAVIKAFQSTDPRLGPTDIAQGWRPDQNIDPRIMVSQRWAPEFQALPPNLRQTIANSLLSAWLDKTLQYPTVSYFQRGLSGSFYKLAPEFLDISGGTVWQAAPEFQRAGVSEYNVRRLQEFGKAYIAMSQLFHY